MKKYACMMEGCNFISGNMEEAKSHKEMGDDHKMLEISEEEGKVSCKEMTV